MTQSPARWLLTPVVHAKAHTHVNKTACAACLAVAQSELPSAVSRVNKGASHPRRALAAFPHAQQGNGNTQSDSRSRQGSYTVDPRSGTHMVASTLTADGDRSQSHSRDLFRLAATRARHLVPWPPGNPVVSGPHFKPYLITESSMLVTMARDQADPFIVLAQLIVRLCCRTRLQLCSFKRYRAVKAT